MKLKPFAIAALFLTLSSTLSCSSLTADQTPENLTENFSTSTRTWDNDSEQAFQQRSLAIRQRVASEDLNKLDAWWRRIKLGDPHKYLLPVILARLSLPEQYDPETLWPFLRSLDKDRPDLYHFRAIYDIRLFFLLRDQLPPDLETTYRQMLESPEVTQWMEQGTENHMFMQRGSGLALMDGSGWPNGAPGVAATNEAWLRTELNKFLTIGQGEFHSSTYYGYAIAGLLNIYDFAKTPELRQLAKASLDWFAANMAVRLSWGTAGGAESRGFDRGTWDGSELAAVGWVWWGDDPQTADRIPLNYARVGLTAALSSYRPPAEMTALAKKEVQLPFLLKASHPNYYSYYQDNQFWETFYITNDYSLSTLLIPFRSYQVQGTINAQYATYKLVIRDPNGVDNAVVGLGGIYHSPMAEGNSTGDQFLQEKGTVLYQLRLSDRDVEAGVPARSHLVLPTRYGEPQKHENWYIWQVENVWLSVRVWGDTIDWKPQVSEKDSDYQVLAANGVNTAWITEVVSLDDAPNLEALKKRLDQTEVDDRLWTNLGQLSYKSITGDRLELIYEPNGGIGRGRVNDRERILGNWAVLESRYLKQELSGGVLELIHPEGRWKLRTTLAAPQWEE
ncbi:MAG: hypothetical protein VKK42_20450 [Lyngbya sp.]|nr:hypothetical protein [Lyngbya sp.]